jgi:hypothetical protein
VTAKLANDLVFDKTANALIPVHSARLQTTGVKTLLITLKYKHILEDAALGFFRTSMHQFSCSVSLGVQIRQTHYRHH